MNLNPITEGLILERGKFLSKIIASFMTTKPAVKTIWAAILWDLTLCSIEGS